jgi:hypothetical protein
MLAGRVLRAWEAAPSTAAISVRDPEQRAAFLAGALAPDAGFVPGTYRLPSELAHYVAPGDLARTLLVRAHRDPERAFALGWATHVLGDVELHPVVGRAVGERLHGDRARRVDALADVATHVSLEVALDLEVLEAEGRALPAAPRRAWSAEAGGASFLAGALGATYGLGISAERIGRDQRRSAWFMRRWPWTLAVVRRGREGGRLARLMGLARERAAPRSAARGLLHPTRPPGWAVDEIMGGAAGFASRFQDAMEGEFVTLGNRNLETGEETPQGAGHAATDAAWEALERMRVQSGGLTTRGGPRNETLALGDRRR